MTQPASQAAYCQSKARYCWNIFQKISPYNLMGRGVQVQISACKNSKHDYLIRGSSLRCLLNRAPVPGVDRGAVSDAAVAGVAGAARRRRERHPDDAGHQDEDEDDAHAADRR